MIFVWGTVFVVHPPCLRGLGTRLSTEENREGSLRSSVNVSRVESELAE